MISEEFYRRGLKNVKNARIPKIFQFFEIFLQNNLQIREKNSYLQGHRLACSNPTSKIQPPPAVHFGGVFAKKILLRNPFLCHSTILVQAQMALQHKKISFTDIFFAKNLQMCNFCCIFVRFLHYYLCTRKNETKQLTNNHQINTNHEEAHIFTARTVHGSTIPVGS